MKQIILLLGIVAALTLSIVPTALAVDPLNDACKGNSASSSTLCQDVKQGQSEDRIMGADGLMVGIAKTLNLAVGAVSGIVIIIGGFKYVLSGGDSNGVASAKNTILYALVGLVVALVAEFIIYVVIGNLK